MEEKKISPSLLALIRYKATGKSSTDDISLPEEMLRVRRDLQEWQSGSLPPGPDASPAISTRWKPRLLIVIGSGLAASLLLGIAILRYSQQPLNQQPANHQQREPRVISESEKLRTEYNDALKKNAEIKLTLADRDRKLDELRRSFVAAELSNKGLQEDIRRLTERVAAAEAKPGWPPDTFLLMGASSSATQTAEPMSSLVIWLRRKGDDQYIGFTIPVDQYTSMAKLVSAKFDSQKSEMNIDNEYDTRKIFKDPNNMITSMLVNKSTIKPPVFPPYRIKLDRTKGTFTGTFGDSRLQGKIY